MRLFIALDYIHKLCGLSIKKELPIKFQMLVFLGFINFTVYAQNINNMIPQNFKIEDIEYGHLNSDTLTDCAIIIRNTEEMDSQELWILLKNTTSSSIIPFKTTNFITARYTNDVSIENGKLILETDHPWHGLNFCKYEFKYSNGVWVCLKASSTHDNGDNIGQRWDNEMDFITGKYKIAHTFTDFEDKAQTRQVLGKKLNSIPPVVFRKNDATILTVQHLKKKYSLFDRNNLWTQTEINGLRAFDSELIIGNWTNKYNSKIQIQFESNGHFGFTDYNSETKQFEILRGTFEIKRQTLLLNYTDKKAQKFSVVNQKKTWHIKKSGNFDFLQENQN